MENLIYLVLLTYPGALVQLLLNEFAPQYIRHESESTALSAARYFFYSAVVSAISIFAFVLFFGISSQGLSAFIEELKRDWRIGQYLCISIIASALFACVWHYVSKATYGLRKNERNTGRRKVWDDIICNKQMFLLGEAIVVIRRGDKTWAGIPEFIPPQIDTDQSICLTRRLFVEDILAHEEERDANGKFIGHDIATYVDMKSGFDITFYAAPKVYDYLGLAGDGGGGGGGVEGDVGRDGK